MIIGLRRHSVRIVEHQPGWLQLGKEIISHLEDTIPGLFRDIQHVDSTAVPGLPAKPIIDIAIALPSQAKLAFIIRLLTDESYIYRGNSGEEGGHLFVMESEAEVRTAHLHLVAFDDPQWRNYLRNRDILRRDALSRSKYAALKKELHLRYPDDRRSYTAGKHAFITSLLKGSSAPEGRLF